MSEYLKAIADLGNTAVLAYVVCVLAPRGASELASLAKWATERIFSEMRAERAECLGIFRDMAGQLAAIAREANGGPLSRTAGVSGPPAAGSKQ